METVKIVKIDKEAVMPHRAHKEDACADIHVLVNQNNRPFYFDNSGNKIETQCFTDHVNLCPNEYLVFHTGLTMAIPDGYVAKIYPRSSTGIKKRLSLSNTVGVIDSNYRGEILLAFKNDSENMVKISHLDKLAQMEIQKVLDIDYIEVDTLDNTERGEGGIGSSGS